MAGCAGLMAFPALGGRAEVAVWVNIFVLAFAFFTALTKHALLQIADFGVGDIVLLDQVCLACLFSLLAQMKRVAVMFLVPTLSLESAFVQTLVLVTLGQQFDILLPGQNNLFASKWRRCLG